jgi:hypothetical protein
VARSIIVDGIERAGVIARVGSRFTGDAFMGSSGISEILLEDRTAGVSHFDVASLKIVEVVEDATASPTTLLHGRVGDHEVYRADEKPGVARAWMLHVQDYNFDLRGIRNLGWYRDAEFDHDRIGALRLAFLDGAGSSSPRARDSTALSGTYIAEDDPIWLPAKRYTDMEIVDIFSEIAEYTGKNFFVTVDGEIFFDRHDSTAYAAGLSIDPDTADGETVFAPMAGISARHGGQQILTGAAMRWGADQKFVEGSDDFGGEAFHDKWEGVLSISDIETAAEAEAYRRAVVKYRTNEDISYAFAISLRADQVDLIKYGQTLDIRHPAVDANTVRNLRAVKVQFEADAPGHYICHIEAGYPRVRPPRVGQRLRRALPSRFPTPDETSARRFYFTGWTCGDVGDGAYAGAAPGGKPASATWDEDPRIADVAYMLHEDPQSTIATRHTPWSEASAAGTEKVVLDQYWLPLTGSGLPNPLVGYVRALVEAYGRSGVGISEASQSLISMMGIRIFRPSTGTFIGTPLPIASPALVDGTEWRPADGTEVENARLFPAPGVWDDVDLGEALTSTAWVAGDYLVVELGARNFFAGATGASVWLDDTASTDLEAEGDHDERTWIEFSTVVPGDPGDLPGDLVDDGEDPVVGDPTIDEAYSLAGHRHSHGNLSDDEAHSHDSDRVQYDPTASGLVSTNTQDAIDELAAAGPGGSADLSGLEILELSAAPGGGWNGLGKPHAAYYNGRTYFAYVKGTNGDACVRSYDHRTGRISAEVVLHAALDADDHASPTILVRDSDHRILVAYSAHNGAALYTRLSTNPEDVSSFAAEVNIDASLGGTAYSYPALIQLTGETNDPVYLFVRPVSGGSGQSWGYATSTDGGATWSALTTFFSVSGRWGYVTLVPNGDARIDLFVQDGSAGAGDATVSVYHGYLEGGSWKKSDGTAAGSLPLDETDLTLVESGAAGGSRHIASLAIDPELGTPIVVYKRFPTATSADYWWSRWTGSAWSTPSLVADDGHFAVNYQSGDVTIDQGNPFIVYASRDVAGTMQLFRYHTRDRGATWEEVQLTDGADDVIFPLSPHNRGAALPMLAMRGSWTNATTYSVDTVGLVGPQVEAEDHDHDFAGDHGTLTGLGDDDHTHYLNETRHDLLDHGGLTGIGSGAERRILLADGRATPFTFTDLLQADDGSDFLWSDDE